MDPIAFQIGPLPPVHWYGILIATGAIAAGFVISYQAKIRKMNPEDTWDIVAVALILGIIGARIYHVLTVSPSSQLSTWYYITHPSQIIFTWEGGLGIYGGIIGGMLGIYLCARHKKQSFLTWLDLAGIGLPLGQAIGRWGNFINQELYGGPTDLPWGITIHPENPVLRVPPYNDPVLYPPETRFHPLFLYESVWNFLVFFLLLYVSHRYRERLLPGEIFAAYLCLYALGRFSLDFIRLDNASIGVLTVAQMVSLACIAGAAGLVAYRRRRTQATETA